MKRKVTIELEIDTCEYSDEEDSSEGAARLVRMIAERPDKGLVEQLLAREEPRTVTIRCEESLVVVDLQAEAQEKDEERRSRVRKIHYAHPTEARWRIGKWMHIHGARFAVCTSHGTLHAHMSENVTHDASLVTCKKCLVILRAIREYERDPRARESA